MVDGYPGDYTREWATTRQKSGAWLKLVWGSAYTVNQVVLYDRPNTNDQITSATLSFSDGSSVPVGSHLLFPALYPVKNCVSKARTSWLG